MPHDCPDNCPDDSLLREMLDSDCASTEIYQQVERCKRCQDRLELLCDQEKLCNSWVDLIRSESQEHRIDTVALKIDRTLGAVVSESELESKAFPTMQRYVVEREIGRGGMGVVFEASDTELGRHVALKMLLSGALAGPERLTRFQREAQAIAKLTHPNIVQIYDVGHHDGVPYLALEYIDTGNLQEHLDGTPWNPRSAAEFIRLTAEGVQAAHAEGLVHRDLKPANILVVKDASLRSTWYPKISDFGLVKSEGDETLTRSGVAVGTPRYLSPEQTVGDEQAIRTQADVYALGCILYQLLSGRPPFQAETIAETIRQICENEPVEIRRLNPMVPRDLATICHKCLRKNPAARYENAGSLAADLQRFERNEPIIARPVSTAEAIAKWSRRNPAVAALSFLLAIIGIILIAIWIDFTGKLSEQTMIAQTKARQAVAREKDAVDSADATREVLRFLTKDLLLSVSPGSEGRDVRVYDVLVAADQQIDSQFVDRPRIEAAIRLGIAESLQALGEYRTALPQAERALELQRQEFGDDSLEAIQAAILLAELHNSLSQTDEALAIVASIEPYAEDFDDETQLDVAATRAGAMYQAGRFAESRDLFFELHQMASEQLGPDDDSTLSLLADYARSRHETGDLKGAQELLVQYREQMIEKHGPNDIKSLQASRDLAVSYAMTGRIKDALRMQKENYELCTEVYGPTHPETNTGLHNYAMALSRNKQYESAQELMQQVVDTSVATLGENHESTINYIGNLAYMHFEFGHADVAAAFLEAYCDPILEIAYDHPNWGVLLLNYGRIRQRLGQLEEAERLLLLAQGIFDRSTGTTELMRKTQKRSLERVQQQIANRKKKQASG